MQVVITNIDPSPHNVCLVDEGDFDDGSKSTAESGPDEQPRDRTGSKNTDSSKYELLDFVSHQGPNSACGHYVRV